MEQTLEVESVVLAYVLQQWGAMLNKKEMGNAY